MKKRLNSLNHYTDLISRHKEYISSDVQEKIRKTRILFLGCGLGSQVALLATRIGFENFILVDGDTINTHNLNRQSFTNKHVGGNKAIILADSIREINPKANIEVHSTFLINESKAKDFVNRSDIVINMADPDEIMYLVNNYSQSISKLVLFPLNVLWGGYVMAFTYDSPTLAGILDGRQIFGNDFYIKFLERTLPKVSNYVNNFYKKNKLGILNSEYIPQLGTTSYLTSAIVVNLMVKWLSDSKIKIAPKPVYIDLLSEIS